MYIGLHWKNPLFLLDRIEIFEKYSISHVMEIRPVGAKLFQAYGRTGRHDEAVTFRNFANAPKSVIYYEKCPTFTYIDTVHVIIN